MLWAAPALALLCAGVVVVAGCGQIQARPAPSATALPRGISATLLPATPAQTAKQVRLWVHNNTSDDLVVNKVRLTDPRFLGYGRPAQYGSVTIPAGQEGELTVTLPPVACTDAATPSPAAVAEQPDPTASPSPTATPTTPAPDTTLVVGFTVGAATGTTSERVSDPDDVIEAYVAAQCR
ncbi:hypothetical protein [Microbacterium sp. SORGH_AS_0888]|uniref:hypothetical protein n=1 Tax=Microbacterium sp. SORGH_AS_0888 TaxID=3041791 RepID=UPI002782DE4D|nr:hypothetical protein [Microbacterium sp. SORGH_AS_0888]MDQ1129573.1 hypothetical protein [Microbacterium sp. SORGH_AS_0888]